VPETTLEIETTTTFRGPLAERLVELAADAGKTPVDLLADTVLDWLKSNQQGPTPATQFRALKKELGDLRERYRQAIAGKPEPSRALVPVAFKYADRETLEIEAAHRDTTVDQLVVQIIDAVAADNLFAAVLDK